MGWTDSNTEYCLKNLDRWRSANFKEQEKLIAEMKDARKLSLGEDEIRLHMDYLDKLTNGDFSAYELLTIPEGDKRFIGIHKK